MNDIDNWLASLGINDMASSSEPSASNADESTAVVAPQVPEEPTTQTLSNDDFNDILSDMGFHEAEDANAVEISDVPFESSDNSEENTEHTEFESEEEWVNTINSTDEDSSQEPETIAMAIREVIPENSPSILLNDSVSRFSGAEWFNEIQTKNIIIAGVGGIGSNLAFQIARMHPMRIMLFDDDRVETANMSGQLFSNRDVGFYKVDAISNMIHEYTSINSIYSYRLKYDATQGTSDIMMCGFDNMEARKMFFQSWKTHVQESSRKSDCLFLDGRLSIDTLQIFCIQGNDDYNISRYAEHCLFSDSEADATVCSLKQTTYLACMIASLMTNLFTNFVANTLNPVIPYDLPFFTEYDAQNMIFKTEA